VARCVVNLLGSSPQPGWICLTCRVVPGPWEDAARLCTLDSVLGAGGKGCRGCPPVARCHRGRRRGHGLGGQPETDRGRRAIRASSASPTWSPSGSAPPWPSVAGSRPPPAGPSASSSAPPAASAPSKSRPTTAPSPPPTPLPGDLSEALGRIHRGVGAH
jgi:hypothetical protein